MKIAIAVPLYKRPKIFELFCESLCENIATLSGVVDITVFFALDPKDDEGENYRIYTNYLSGFKQSMFWEIPNKPLSNKWNKLVQLTQGYEWDYLFIAGSDALFSNSFWMKVYMVAQNNIDYMGIYDYFIYNTKDGQMKHWNGFSKDRKGEVIGGGRLLKRSLVQQLNFTLWEEGLNVGLDKSMTKGLGNKVKVHGMWCKDEAICMMELKSEVNIHSFESWGGNPVQAGHLLPAFFKRDIVNKIVNLKP